MAGRITVYFGKPLGKLTPVEKSDIGDDLVREARDKGFYGVMDVRYREESMNTGAGMGAVTEVSGIPSRHCSEI